MAKQKARNTSRGRTRSWFSGKEIAGTRKPKPRSVQQLWRKYMRLLQTKDLLAQRDNVGTEGIARSGREILADRLQRATENLGNSIEVLSPGGRRRPQIQEWQNAEGGSRPRRCTGNKCYGGLVKVLTEALIVAEEEGLVFLKGSTKGGSKLIALKRRRGT